jgi:hypothetical protein
MGIRTGRPLGRPKGSRNKSTVAREFAAIEAARRIAALVGLGSVELAAQAFLTLVSPPGVVSVPLSLAHAGAVQFDTSGNQT